MAENDDDPFGFSSMSVKDKIKQIRPSVPPDPPRDMAIVDAAAQSAGFISREATLVPEQLPYRSSRTQRVEPRIPLNMRVPLSLGGAFQRFCEENRYSYPEGLAEVM